MVKFTLKIVLLIPVLCSLVYPQANGKRFGIAFNLDYTSTSKLFLQPNAIDPFIRNTHENLDKITSYSVDIRYQISESIIIGVGSGLMEKTFENSINLGGIKAKMTDGYRMIPLEFSAFYMIPFSSAHFKFFFGGGFGFYLGKHIRELGDVSVAGESNKIGYGIHAAIGMDYVIFDFLSVRGQMRFRDPEFEMRSKYSSKTVNYNDEEYTLTADTFNSKVNIDGIAFTIGVAFNF